MSEPDMFSLAGRMALITGGGKGIGLSLAAALAKAGAEIVLSDMSASRVESAAADLAGLGAKVSTAVFDVSNPSETRAAISNVEKQTGEIDILVNNAGIHRYAALVDMTFEQWRQVLDVNLTGAFLAAQAVAPGMIARGHGKIINICSLMSEGARPTTANYTAAKGGLKMLTKAMCVEWAPHNIQVNGIGPGYILTELTKPLAEKPEFDAWVKGRTPAGRWGTPADLAGAAVFLASGASDFVNGQVLYVDGGWLAAL